MVQNLVGHQVRVVHLEVLVGDDEGDVVAVVDDVLDEGVLQRVAHHVAVGALHGVGPEHDVVLLLLLEALGHLVGVEQRKHPQRQADEDDDHAVAERKVAER